MDVCSRAGRQIVMVETPAEDASCGRRFKLKQGELFGAHAYNGRFRTTLCQKLAFDRYEKQLKQMTAGQTSRRRSCK